MRTHLHPRRTAALAGGLLVAGVALGVVHSVTAGAAEPVPPSLAKAIRDLTSEPRYAHSSFAIQVEDRGTGEVLVDERGDAMSTTGSVLKVYGTSTALHLYGQDHTFHTPVFRTGPVRNGAVQGDLVLVASGDFSMGLREQPDGTMAFASAPSVDHTYANTGLPAIEVGNDPLTGVNDLAQQVAASGITKVRGDVIVDDRLFDTFFGWPDVTVSPASPIMINDNRIDILSTPTKPGQAAQLDYRPKTAAFRVTSNVKTVKAGGATDLTVTQPKPNVFQVSGTIAADAGPTLRIGEIPNPASFARTAFIEALQRAGVTVTAPPTGANPVDRLPAKGSFPADQRVAEHVSGSLAEIVKVILKTSHNPGADLMACLDAVASGSKDCEQGLVTVQQYITKDLGVDPTAVFLFDGAGSDDRDRSAGTAFATFLRAVDDAALRRGVRGRPAGPRRRRRPGQPGSRHAGRRSRLQQDRARERPSSRLASASSTPARRSATSTRRRAASSSSRSWWPTCRWIPNNINTLIQVITDVANLSVAIYEAY